MVDDLVDDLVDGGVDGAPVVGEDDRLTAHDPFGEAFKQVGGVGSEPEEGLFGELDPEGLQLEGAVVYGHFKIL